jgi:hypothetical protein
MAGAANKVNIVVMAATATAVTVAAVVGAAVAVGGGEGDTEKLVRARPLHGVPSYAVSTHAPPWRISVFSGLPPPARSPLARGGRKGLGRVATLPNLSFQQA